MARRLSLRGIQIACVLAGSIASFAIWPLMRNGLVSRQSVQLGAGLCFVAVGLFALYRLATGDGVDPKAAHGSRAAARLNVGFVVLGVGNILIETWLGIALLWVAMGVMLSSLFSRKTPSA